MVFKAATDVQTPPRAMAPAQQTWLALSPQRLWQLGSRRERWLVFAGWALSVVACMALGLATVMQSWSGLPLRFGGFDVYITLYPPLLICLWWTLCFGWWWGAIPAYLATFTLALYAGMPLPWALVFACANPLGFAVLTVGYRALAIPCDMRSVNSVLYYLLLAFVGSIFGSAGALIWSYTNQIDRTALLPIWQGWWLGSFLQSIAFAAPLLALSWPALARWKMQRQPLLAPEVSDLRRRALHLIWATVAGVLIYGLLNITLGTARVEQALRAGDAVQLEQAARVLASTSWVFFWVFALIVLFVALFIYRLLLRWMDVSDEMLQQLSTLARTDMLTGIHNRRAIEESLLQQWERWQRYGEPTGVLILDIDHFKAINDGHGHDAGDAVIRALAERLRANARTNDTIGRWGGDEFLLILPQTDQAGLWQLAQRLLHDIQSHAVAHGSTTLQYTVSVGMSLFAQADGSIDAPLKRADQALYQAKAQGRNCGMLAGQQDAAQPAPRTG